MSIREHIIGLLFAGILFSNALEAQLITISPKWQKGEKKTIIECSSGWLNLFGEEKESPLDTISIYTIEIITRTDTGYILEWKKLFRDNDKGYDKLEKKYAPNHTYLISTDSLGKFNAIDNWQDLVKKNKKNRNQFINSAQKENIKDTAFLNFEMFEMGLAETESELINQCQNLKNVFLGMYGLQIKLNDTVYRQSTVPDKIIIEGIPVTYKTTSKPLDEARILIKCSRIYDFQKLNELRAKYSQEKIEDEFDLTFYYEIIYNSKSGWIENITYYNKTKSKNINSEDIIQYKIQ